MKQETAVEWLTKELSAILGPIKTEPMQDLLIVDAMKKAKQMFEMQITNAFQDGKSNGMDISHPKSRIKEISSNQYYAAFFKK